jgi:hypothetical protein
MRSPSSSTSSSRLEPVHGRSNLFSCFSFTSTCACQVQHAPRHNPSMGTLLSLRYPVALFRTHQAKSPHVQLPSIVRATPFPRTFSDPSSPDSVAFPTVTVCPSLGNTAFSLSSCSSTSVCVSSCQSMDMQISAHTCAPSLDDAFMC